MADDADQTDEARSRSRRALLTAGSAGAAGLALTVMGGTGAQASGRSPTERANARRVRTAFDRAARRGTLGRDNAFYLDLLAPDVRWTIASAVPRTYADRADFLENGSAPILQRLRTPIVPRVRSLVAHGDDVTVLWDGTATALDGEPYPNTYVWIFTMRGRQASRVTALLDLVAVNALVERVPPRS